MAVNVADLALDLRLIADLSVDVPAGQVAILTRHLAAASALVSERTSGAPEALADQAVLAIASYSLRQADCGRWDTLRLGVEKQRGKRCSRLLCPAPGWRHRHHSGVTAMWPFTRTERRDFTQITSDRALNAAIGNTALADATSTAAAAIAMGIYGRTFAAAEVAPSVERTGLTAHVLNQIGQSLISSGESLSG